MRKEPLPYPLVGGPYTAPPRHRWADVLRAPKEKQHCVQLITSGGWLTIVGANRANGRAASGSEILAMIEEVVRTWPPRARLQLHPESEGLEP